MRNIQQLLVAGVLLLTAASAARQQPDTPKPKIVIGMMVDQMRWDLSPVKPIALPV